MKIAVGSTNPVKIEATQAAFAKTWPDHNFEFTGLKVESGVSSQPESVEDSIRGARNRAQGAIEVHEADYGVGMENGVTKIGGNFYDQGWVVVVNRLGRDSVASTLLAPLPREIARLIQEGRELGEAADIVFNTQNSKQNGSFVSEMTDGQITRANSYKDAVIVALARFLHPELF